MAVRTQILEQGLKNAVILFTNTGDVEAAVTKVDVTTLTPPCLRVDIEKIKYAVAGAAAASLNILWDAGTPDLAWVLPAPESGEFNFKDVGGLINPKSTGWTGNIKFTVPASTPYSVILWLEKKQD